MAYFKDVRTAEELKRQWRHLVKMYHPDLGGTDEIMRQINLEYDSLLRRVGNVHEGKDGTTWTDEKGPKDRYTCDINDLDDGFRDVILELLKMDGIEILLVGSWIWLEGETRQWKEALKKIGCRWSAPRQRWYWHKADKYYRHAKKATFGEICAKYGVKTATRGSSEEKTLIA